MNSNTSLTGTRSRVAVFASGGGSNFQALADASRSGRLSADIVLCLTDRTGAGAIERASGMGIPSVVIRPGDFENEAEYSDRMSNVLDSYRVEYVALAGYLKKIPSEIVRRYRGRMVNIHPALLPSFGGRGMYGRRVHEAVLEHGVRWTGVTVHLVDEDYDTGPIVLQEPVPVYQTDSVDELGARVLEVEHELYPRALGLVVDGRIRVEGRRVIIVPDSG